MDSQFQPAPTKITDLPRTGSVDQKSLSSPAGRSADLLLAVSLVFYLLTRLIGLESYPIYFFSDEAAQSVLAQDLVSNAWRSPEGEFLPTYFYNGYQYNLGLSVYLQVIPYLLFGKSILVTRGTSALVSLAVPLFTALIFRNVFRSRFYWLPALILTITPAWFLHSRTAFETSLAVSMYAGFVYFYMMYRTRSAGYLYPAVLFAALAFYSYSPGRVVVGLTAALLFIFDWRYHLRNWKTLLPAAALLAALAVPLVRFLILHPGENLQHLHQLNAYWIKDIPLTEKISRYTGQYLWGLSPVYWFSPGSADIERHTMGPFGHQLLAFLPFTLTGFWIVLKKISQPESRALLITFLTAPSGAALVEIGITRTLFMIIPLAVFSGLGMILLLEWVIKKRVTSHTMLSLSIFLALFLYSAWFTGNALVNGPFWHKDYGLYGMQYGARQVFDAIASELREKPEQPIILSPSWTNGADTVARFFFDEPLPFEIGSIQGYADRYQPFDEQTLFIMIPDELESLDGNDKFTGIEIMRSLPFPDGQAGFYFVHLQYAPGAEDIFTREKLERSSLLEKTIHIGDIPVQIKYSHLDMGEIEHIFDGDQDTVIRTLEANPMQLQVTFPAARPISMLRMRIGGNPTLISVEMQDQDGKALQRVEQQFPETADPRSIEIQVDKPAVKSIRLSITTLYSPEPSHVHLWEVKFIE